LLVLDEPTASLDPDVALRVRTGLLDVCRDEGTALLVTSHDMLEVERMCERVVFVVGGRIVADGSPAVVAAQYGHGNLESVFLDLAGAGPDGQSLDPVDVSHIAPHGQTPEPMPEEHR
jgi:ABC-2 type transport system ATP-binding protein